METNPLTPEEKQVIENKGTEPPFSGKFNDFFEPGIYTCRKCDAPLYRSDSKFRSSCGWPSFDEAIAGAVRRRPDADGIRTEITCRRCGAHLGHVFEGEMLTPKNARYCVNSISMNFVSEAQFPKNFETAYLGGGCFWCLEAVLGGIKGIVSVTPGYAGGKTANPKYEEVSRGNTGHAEVVKVVFDPTIISFEGLLDIFFDIHDPTTPNRQGNDIGPQYRSIVLYNGGLQKEITQKVIQELEANKIFDAPIVTEVRPLEKFYEAEDYHCDYYAKNPGAPYCRLVIAPKIEKFRKKA